MGYEIDSNNDFVDEFIKLRARRIMRLRAQDKNEGQEKYSAIRDLFENMISVSLLTAIYCAVSYFVFATTLWPFTNFLLRDYLLVISLILMVISLLTARSLTEQGRARIMAIFREMFLRGEIPANVIANQLAKNSDVNKKAPEAGVSSDEFSGTKKGDRVNQQAFKNLPGS